MPGVNVALYVIAWRYPVLRGAPPRGNLDGGENGTSVPNNVDETDMPDHVHQLQPILETTGVELRPRPQAEEYHRSKKDCFLNMKSFVAMVALITMLVATDTMLRYAVLTTLEKRFGFLSYENGIIISSYDIGHVVFLVVLSFVGAKVHKPRFCALGGFFGAAAGVLWAMPHVIFGPGPKPLPIPANVTESDVNKEMCLSAFNMTHDVCATMNATAAPAVSPVEATVSFWMLFVSQCLLGAGLAPFLTVAITYIDDNTDPQTSALFVGIFYSIGTFGMVLGFLLGAVTTSLYVDLSDTFLTPEDPEWIGAWWLGSLILGCINAVCSLPLMFFPRKMRQEQTISPRISMYSHESIHSSEERSRAEKMRPMLQRKVSEIQEPSLKAFSSTSKSVFTNVVFMAVTLGLCGITFIPAGIFTFLPKYLETQFLASTMVANIVTAVVTALAMATGTFAGGYVSSSLNLNPHGNVKMVFFTCAFGIACMTGAMFLGCPQPPFAADIGTDGLLNVTQSCNRDCSCGFEFSPVCGDNNVNYYSACHAGCSVLGDVVNDVGNLTGCTCTGGGAHTGFCDLGCDTMIPYAILIFLSIFAICMGQSPSLSLVVRVVDPEMKAFALGVNNVLTSILASIPGPILFGRMIDATCILMAPSCKGDGLCIAYENDGFRYVLHGITIAAVFVAVVCFLVAWLKIRTEDWSHLDQSPASKDSKTNGKSPEKKPMVEMKQMS